MIYRRFLKDETVVTDYLLKAIHFQESLTLLTRSQRKRNIQCKCTIVRTQSTQYKMGLNMIELTLKARDKIDYHKIEEKEANTYFFSCKCTGKGKTKHLLGGNKHLGKRYQPHF